MTLPRQALHDALQEEGYDFGIFALYGTGRPCKEPWCVLARERVWTRMRAWRSPRGIKLSLLEIAEVTIGKGKHGTVCEAIKRHQSRNGAGKGEAR